MSVAISGNGLVGASKRTVDVGPIFLHGDTNQSFMDENRGLTGTSYAAVQLAFALRRGLPSWTINLVTMGGSVFGENQDSNFRLDNLAEFSSESDLLICPSETLCHLFPQQTAGKRVIVISQHPRDLDLVRARKVHRPILEVHVSVYSFWENFSPLVRSYYLPNSLWLPNWQSFNFENQPDSPLTIGFLGALVPEKGFLHVARAWREIRQSIPNARLEVVGGSSLYGVSEDHPLIPTTPEYGDKIWKALGPGPRLEDLGIRFLGRTAVGKSSIIDQWDFAIVNPTGFTESFCYSFRELCSQGVPTFFGSREGLREFATDFPELALHDPTELASKVVDLAKSVSTVESIRERTRVRSVVGANEFESRLDGFIELLPVAYADRGARLRMVAMRSWPPLSGWVVAELWANSSLSLFLRKRVLGFLTHIAALVSQRRAKSESVIYERRRDSCP